jgi:hypothetical protein
MPVRRIIGLSGMKLGFWKLKAAAGIGNTKNWPTWHAWQILSANPVWIPLPSWSPFSVMTKLNRSVWSHRFPIGLYIYTCGPSSYSSNWASGRHLIGFIILQSFLYKDVRGLVCCFDLWKKKIPLNCIVVPLCACLTKIFLLLTFLLHFFNSSWCQVFI